MEIMLRLLALVVLPVLCMGGVLNLIENGAQMVTEQQIINSFPRIQTSAPTALFSLLHWKNDINTKEISELLQIDVKTDKEGLQLCDTPICDGSLCIRGCIASLEDTATQASRIADFCATTTEVICVAVSASDLRFGSSSHALQLLQAVLHEKALIASRVKLFVFVHGSAEGEENMDVQRATEMVRQAWDDLSKKEATFEELVDAQVHAFPYQRDTANFAAARSKLAEALRATTRMNLQNIAEFLPRAWSVIARSPTKRVMTSMHRTALFRVDRAYETAIKQVERLSSVWIQRVDSKKVVGGFGEQADSLAKRVLAAYDNATIGVSSQRHQAQRREEIVAYISKLYRRLFEQQTSNLLSDATQRLREELMNIARSAPAASEEVDRQDTTPDGVQVTEVEPPEQSALEFMAKMNIPPEKEAFVAEFFALLDTIPSTKNLPFNEQQTFDALLQVDYWLFSRLKELEVPSIELYCTDTMKAAQRSLRDFVDKFPSSPAAQAAAYRETEDQLERPPQQGKLSIRPKLNFVVSIEAPGAGNLQGYATYAFDFGTVWFAFSNERDKDANLLFPAPPMLRIQPKLHFDVERK